MYTDRDVSEVKRALRRFVLLYSLLALVLLGAIVVDQFIRLVWLSYVAAVVLAAASLFLWGIYGVRLISWRKFLADMQNGLERTVSGVLHTIDEEEAVREGLEFRAIRLMTGEESDKAGGRLLYVDVSRFPLPVTIGQTVRCRLFGNYVKHIELAEEE